MTTLGDLVDDVLGTLHGWSQQQEQSSYLTATVDADDLSIPVNDASGFTKGQIEIDGELLWVDSVAGNTLLIAPYGRGYRSTVAASHSSGVRVTFRPSFPRSRVITEINNTIGAISDDVYGINTGNLEYDGPQYTYELPADDFADFDDVLSVAWDLDDGNNGWLPVRRWKVDRFADTTMFPSGVSLTVLDAITPGSTVRVTFKQAAQPFDPAGAESQALTAVTHLAESCRDLLTLGATAALAFGADLGASQTRGPGMDAVDDTRAPGAATQVARQLFARYQLRVDSERSRLLSSVPSAVHYTR
jgi:hypothetical protein